MDLSGSENDNWCEVSVCVAASVHLVLDLTPPVNLVCEWGFPSVSVSDCETVDPQTFSFSGKRCASVALECEAQMNIEGPPVKAVPKAVRNRPTTQKCAFQSSARMGKEQSAASTRRDAIAADCDVAHPANGLAR